MKLLADFSSQVKLSNSISIIIFWLLFYSFPTQAQTLNNSSDLNSDRSLSQINNVRQLRDISPTDWAYDALQTLIQRYGCTTGFPDLTYRGSQTISRYEFASGLNSCLSQFERLTGSSYNVLQTDLDTLIRLIQEFQKELALLQGKTDGIRARTDELDVTQFSETAKLTGEAVFGLESILTGEGERNPIFGDRVRLSVVTSLKGEDLLLTRLSTGNLTSFSDDRANFFDNLAFNESGSNNLSLDVLSYNFSLDRQTDIILGATGIGADDILNTLSILDGDGSYGALSTFGTRNSIYLPPGDAGIGINHRFSNKLQLNVGYLAAPANETNQGNGLFNGSFSAIAQILVTPTDNFQLAATYIHGYNQSDPQSGSSLANLQTLTRNLFGEAVSTINDSYSLEFSWSISDRLILGSWGTLSQVTTLSTLGGQLDRGKQSVWSWATTIAAPDLGKKGNLAGFIIGMQPFVADSSLIFAEDNDISLHLEAFYQYRVTDNLAITPGIIWITSPNSDRDSEDLTLATIRTTFSF
jgi:hypothetical protein